MANLENYNVVDQMEDDGTNNGLPLEVKVMKAI